jgi:amidase
VSFHKGLRNLRVGIDENYNFLGSDRSTIDSVQAAIKVCGEMGAVLVPVKIPQNPTLIADIEKLAAAEAALVHEATFPARASEYGEHCAAALRRGRALTAFEYQKIVERRRDLRNRMDSLFNAVHLVVTPVQAFAAPTAESMNGDNAGVDRLEGLARFTCPFNMTGHPSITLPARPTSANMPVGLQIVASHGGEDILLRAAITLQAATDWHLAHPAM